MTSDDQFRNHLNPDVFDRRRALIAAVGFIGWTAVASACADDGPAASVSRVAGRPGDVAPPGVTGEIVEVVSIDNTFRPDRIEIEAGTEVVWLNRGRNAHDILPVEGAEWGVATEDFPPGATYSHVFAESGEVPYYCSIHGTTERGMVGLIVVA